jgi:hypothetical protein
LCDPVIGEERVSAVAGLEADQTLHHASARSELTAALARDHMPVLLADQAAALTLIRSLSSAHFIDVGEHFVHARELPKADVSRSDRRLLAEVRHSLEASGAKVTHVALAACLCDPGRRAALCVEDETREHVMTLEAGARWRRRFGSGLRLLLVQEHAAIIAARAMAEREASTAGQLLARYLLAEQYGELSVRQSDGILEHGLQGLQKATKRSRARGAR